MELKWEMRFIGMAQQVASWSEDNSTKVGAVIVTKDNDILTLGWNGLPRGIKLTAARETRPEKYMYFEHAERNAIYNATRNGVTLKDAIIYVTHFPCADCARAIIQSGIKVVYYAGQLTDAWSDQTKASEAMLTEAGIVYIWLETNRADA